MRATILDRTTATCGAYALVLLAVAVLATPQVWRTSNTDVDLYANYGGRIARGAVPYRDFFIEYPPGSLAAIAFPSMVTSERAEYGRVFVSEMIALLALTIIATAAAFTGSGSTRGRVMLALLPLSLAPVLLGPVSLQRFDLMAALCSAVAVVSALRCRFGIAGVALGLGAAIKIYPIVLLVPLAIFARSKRGPRAVLHAGIGFLASTGIVLAPFVAVGPGGIEHVLRYQFGRPLQVETVFASGALIGQLSGLFRVGLGFANGSVNYAGPHALLLHDLEKATLALTLAVLLTTSLKRAKREPGFIASLASITCAIVALGGVLSPQYVIWLLPIVPLLRGRLGVASTVALLAVMAATRIEYRNYYVALVQRESSNSILALAGRNLLLLILLAITVASLFTQPDVVSTRRGG